MAHADHETPESDPRPLKRPRKTRADERNCPPIPSPPLDHIFIAESLVSKKPGGKKAPLSCCECRRLKLKCDRSFPCASCKKRGCSEICPDGVLVSGKGTRFILANTEQLHTKIHEMSDRIRHLEDALVALQATCSPDPHPLMHPDMLGIKSTMGLYGGTQLGAEPTTPLPSTATASTEESTSLSMDVDSREARQPSEETVCAVANAQSPHGMSIHGGIVKHEEMSERRRLDAEIMQLSHAFPLSEKVSPERNLPLRTYIRSLLPDKEEAEYLWEQAKQNALWQYNPHPSETFFPNLLHHCYYAAAADLCPRRLALLMMILAVGCLVDLTRRGPDSPDAERYHNLGRAALCEIPVMEETNVETITALFYEIWYLLVFSDKKKAAGYAWGLMGLTAKLAQSIGLHRNGSKSKVIPEEVEKRRSLFWELLYLDARLSLSLGRPPSLCIGHMDCNRPSYIPDEGCDPSESLHYYQEWKHSCYEHCLAPVLDVVSGPNPEYSTVLDLDKRIRDFSIPVPLQNGGTQSRSLIMQRASLAMALEAVLLQLHRTFFTRALSGPEEAFNRRHKYAPSVVAVFLSASRMIATVQDLYQREPQLTARILGYWSNAFSAAVALCLLVSRAPFTCLSPAALQELERARVLFNSAKEACPRALQVIPILETMIEKANDIYSRWSKGQDMPTIVLRHADDSPEADGSTHSPQLAPAPLELAKTGVHSYSPSPASSDSFIQSHRSLSQCIVEVHQRAKLLFPMRKPCKCSMAKPTVCPPSHSWSPPPLIPQLATTPVLPDLYSGNFTFGVLPVCNDGSRAGTERAMSQPLSPTSRLAVVDTLNFELGALNPSSDQSWMAFF